MTLASDGWCVATWDVDGTAAVAPGRPVVRRRRRSSGRAAGFAVDIANGDSVRAAVVAVEEQLGPIEALVNNASIDVIKPFVPPKTSGTVSPRSAKPSLEGGRDEHGELMMQHHWPHDACPSPKHSDCLVRRVSYEYFGANQAQHLR